MEIRAVIKSILVIVFYPVSLVFSIPLRNLIRKIYSSKKTLKHDIVPDLRTQLLNPLHQIFVGKLPNNFKIYNNQIDFSSDGGVMSVQAYYVGEVEYHQIKYLVSNHINNGMVFIDVGGHHGAFTTIVGYELNKRKFGGEIHVFEPSDENIDYLKRNIKSNSVEDKVSIIKAAVGATSEEGLFVKSTDNSCNWATTELLVGEKDLHSEKVKIISLDDYCQNFEKLDLIKMDIQGGELKALKGAKKIIQKFLPIIFVEIVDYEETSKETKAFLKSINYSINYLNERGELVPENSKDIFISWDVIAIPMIQ